MLYRLLAVTAAGMYALGALYAPEEVVPRQTSVEDAAPAASAVEVGRNAFAALGFSLEAPKTVRQEGFSEREAIRIALERGEVIKAEREAAAKGIVLSSVSAGASADAPPAPQTPAAVETAAAVDAGLWTVTGSTVNLRAGPGTGHAVVGQAREGDLARPLGDTGGDWIHIEMSGTGDDAWISARFLKPAQG